MWYTIREGARECESYIENSWCQSHNPREPRALWPSSLDVTFPHKGERWGNHTVTDLRCPGQNSITGYSGWDEMKCWNLDVFSVFLLSCIRSGHKAREGVHFYSRGRRSQGHSKGPGRSHWRTLARWCQQSFQGDADGRWAFKLLT